MYVYITIQQHSLKLPRQSGFFFADFLHSFKKSTFFPRICVKALTGKEKKKKQTKKKKREKSRVNRRR